MEPTSLLFPGTRAARREERLTLPIPGISAGHPYLFPAFRTVLARFANNPCFALAFQSSDRKGVYVDDLRDNPTFGDLKQRAFAAEDVSAGCQCAVRLNGASASGAGAVGAEPEYPLELIADDNGCRLTFAAESLEKELAQRIGEHLASLLPQIEPQRRVAEVRSTQSTERATLDSFNQTASSFPQRSISSLFRAQDPDRVALLTGDGPVTYRELTALRDRYVGQIERVLPGERVALRLPRSKEFFAAVLACIEKGAVFVPMDPAYPEDRTQFMLEDCQARFVFEQSGSTVTITERATTSAPCSGDALYVLYTSGSTGRPKGVIGSHRATLNRLEWAWREFPFAPDDVACAKTSPNFVDAIAEFLGPLLTGTPSVVLDDSSARDPMILAAAIEKYRVTRLVVVPSLLRVLLEHREQLGSLRHLVSSGETLLPDLVSATLAALPEARLFNYYGSSEVAGDATYYPVLHPVEGGVPIGRPIANTGIHLLDPMGGETPLGARGEIAVSGANLAEGYLHRPDLTAGKFTDHFIYGRLYRTGDLGEWLPDGTLLYHGREDNMVKVRGYRIELYEIETILKSVRGIEECAVVQGPGGNVIHAYFAPPVVSKDAAREHLRAKLPEYMVPARFIPLEALPKLPNGKIDRRGLVPPPEDENVDPPIGRVEERIHRIFCEILHAQAIGREENFFDRGGDSLRAASAASRLAREFQIEITTNTVFESPTIAELGTFCSVIIDMFEGQFDPSDGTDVEAAMAAEYALTEGAQEIPLRSNPSRAQLSLQQQRLWLLEEIKPAGSLYNIATAYRIRGKVSAARLQAGLSILVERHETLRTAIRLENGVPVQEILAPVPVELPEFTVETEAEYEKLADEMATVEMALEKGRLFRAALVHLSPEHHVLFFTTHHIISDGWSVAVMAEELSRLYANPVAPLPKLPIQYGDYAAWQQQWIRSGAIRHQYQYWAKSLRGSLPLLDLPTDYPRPALQSHEGRTVGLTVPAQHISAIQQSCEGVTPFMVLLAIFQSLLWRATDQPDILVGTPYAGRTRTEIEGIVGFFVNTLVIRSSIDPGMTLPNLLRQVREATLRAFEHPDVPFESLVEELKPERNLAYSPIFQAFFVLNTPAGERMDGGLDIRIEERHNRGAKFDLTIELTQEETEIHGRLEYPTALFAEETIRAFAEQFVSAVQRAAAHPEITIEDLFAGALAPASPAPRVSSPSLTAGLLTSAPATAPALISHAGVVTYGELARRVDALTEVLRQAGAELGDIVAIQIERSPEAIVALLATLQAGCVYLPLDPKYPRERIDFMLADAAPKLVIGAGLEITTRSEGKPAPMGGDPAYILYTSGSTGRPKGVVGTHHATINRLAWMERCHPFASDEVAIHKTSLNFVDSVAEIFAPLRAGIPLVIPEDSLPEAVANSIEQHRVTRLIAVPSLLHALVEMGAGLGSLRLIVSSGEVLPKDLAQSLLELLPGTKLLNLYGSSEVAGGVTSFEVTPESLTRASISIGRPIDNAEVLILDQKLRAAPDGFPGQIVVRGPVMASGYFHGPQDRFANGLFLTGDLGRRHPGSGLIEYMGRKDRQMKVAGVRIEPEEIEAVLRSHPRVRDAAVFLHHGALAMVVDATDCVPEELKHFSRSKLPTPMVPQQIAIVESLPQLPNGKIDRAALSCLLRSPGDVVAEPLTPRAAAIAPIWQSILQLEALPGGNAHFFDMGGNSLAAARLRATLLQRLGIDAPTGLIFECPTLNAYAEAIGRKDTADLAVQLEADSTLADSLRFSPAPAARPVHVLFTGATGFLGAPLVRTLLEQGIRITALVRTAGAKLPKGMDAIVGNIELPLFGLEPAAYAALAAEVDSVVHAAAKVKFLEPYSTCRNANVLGTLEVLKFCTAGKAKTLTYFSTLAVFEALGATAIEPIKEDTPLESSSGNAIGYTQSKWVAERLVQKAMGAGLSARILRPGPTSGDSQTGEGNADDFQGRFIAGCIALGAYPDIESRIDFTPVDYVTQAAVELVLSPVSVGRAYHLNTPHPLTIHETFARIGIPKLSWEDWWSAVHQHMDNPIADTLPIWDATIRAGFSVNDVLQIARNFDTGNTQAAVQVECPLPDDRLITTLIAPLVPADLRSAGGAVSVPPERDVSFVVANEQSLAAMEAKLGALSPASVVAIKVDSDFLQEEPSRTKRVAAALAHTPLPDLDSVPVLAEALLQYGLLRAHQSAALCLRRWVTEDQTSLQAQFAIPLREFFALRTAMQSSPPDFSATGLPFAPRRDKEQFSVELGRNFVTITAHLASP